MIATRHGLGSVRPRIVYIDVRSTMTQSGLEDVVVVVVAHGDVVVAQTQPGPGGAILTDYIILYYDTLVTVTLNNKHNIYLTKMGIILFKCINK